MRIAYVAVLVLLLTLNRFSEIEARERIEDFAWLAGCWESNAGGQQFSENWMKPSGKTMLGMGRYVKNNETLFYEFLQIRETPDGNIYFVALPSGQKEASFKLIRRDINEAIFENPEHDFPQRVMYRLEGKDSLNASVEGMDLGKQRKEEFPMKRVACD